MATTDRSNSIIINWDPVNISLADLRILADYVADIDEEAAQPWAATQLGSAPGSPHVATVQMGSPLIVEIVSYLENDTAGILTLGAIGYFIKHLEAFGGWVARFRGASYRGRAQALIDKGECLRAKAEIEAHGEPILKFELAATLDLQLSLAPPVSESEVEAEAEAEAEADMWSGRLRSPSPASRRICTSPSSASTRNACRTGPGFSPCSLAKSDMTVDRIAGIGPRSGSRLDRSS